MLNFNKAYKRKKRPLKDLNTSHVKLQLDKLERDEQAM